MTKCLSIILLTRGFTFKINGSSNKILTFNDILDQSLKMAKVLHGMGLRKNDVIAIVAENRQEYAAISFGALFLNAIVAPVNVTYTESKILIRVVDFVIISHKIA